MCYVAEQSTQHTSSFETDVSDIIVSAMHSGTFAGNLSSAVVNSLLSFFPLFEISPL